MNDEPSLEILGDLHAWYAVGEDGPFAQRWARMRCAIVGGMWLAHRRFHDAAFSPVVEAKAETGSIG